MSDFEKYWEENASKESWANKAVAAKIWSDKQAKIDELQKRIDEALKILDAESANSWGIWKEKACMYEQGASNAYERSYWILKGKPDDQTRN